MKSVARFCWSCEGAYIIYFAGFVAVCMAEMEPKFSGWFQSFCGKYSIGETWKQKRIVLPLMIFIYEKYTSTHVSS